MTTGAFTNFTSDNSHLSRYVTKGATGYYPSTIFHHVRQCTVDSVINFIHVFIWGGNKFCLWLLTSQVGFFRQVNDFLSTWEQVAQFLKFTFHYGPHYSNANNVYSFHCFLQKQTCTMPSPSNNGLYSHKTQYQGVLTIHNGLLPILNSGRPMYTTFSVLDS